MQRLLSLLRASTGLRRDEEVDLLPTTAQPQASTSLPLPLPYHDDPAAPETVPQQYIDSKDGRTRPLVVQSLHWPCPQGSSTWQTVKAKTNSSLAPRAGDWVTGGTVSQTNVVFKLLACLWALVKAVILSPLFACLPVEGIEDPQAGLSCRKSRITCPIPAQYPEFRGVCHEYPKHARSNLDAVPTVECSGESSASTTATGVREQIRLYRPRKLFVKVGVSWEIIDDSVIEAEKPYIFISYAANQFEREQDGNGRLVLTDRAAKRLQQRAETIVEENNLEAYWIDFLRAPEQPEATDDVHRFCDVVRGSEKVCVLLSETKDLSNSLAMFGKRLWCLPECLLAPGHVIHVEGGDKIETISIMQLPARAWTNSYTDDNGNTVQGNGKKEEFRLLAEHFSGLLTLSRLELFSVALSAMRSLEFFPFQDGDMAYALMGLLRKRPSMDPSDSEQQALARLCLSNDSDRIVERMACMLPVREAGSTSWLGMADSFGANLWDIEPTCQVAGICHDEAVIIDGCHAASIEWGATPRIRFQSRKSRTQKLVFILLRLKTVMNIYFVGAALFHIMIRIAFYIAHTTGREVERVLAFYSWTYYTIWPPLVLGFIMPFCLPFVLSGEIDEIQPRLIGFSGTMPIEQLERMVFGNCTGRLEYTASSGLLCARDSLTRKGIAPAITADAIPLGHHIFTLVDTGSLTVSVFSAPRPPTVALLCGNEGGMLRVALCSYNPLTNSLRKETVLRRETRMLMRSSLCSWIKLEL